MRPTKKLKLFTDDEKSEKIMKRIIDKITEDDFLWIFGDYPENIIAEDDLHMSCCEDCLLTPCCSERCEQAFEEIKSFIYHNKYMDLKEYTEQSYQNKIISRRSEARKEKKQRRIKRRVIKKLGYDEFIKGKNGFLCESVFWNSKHEEEIEEIWKKNCKDENLLHKNQFRRDDLL